MRPFFCRNVSPVNEAFDCLYATSLAEIAPERRQDLLEDTRLNPFLESVVAR